MLCTIQATRTDLKIMMLSEKSQTKKMCLQKLLNTESFMIIFMLVFY